LPIFLLFFYYTLDLSVIKRDLTPGELISCYAIFGYLTAPINSLINMNKTIQDAVIAADRLFEIMDIEREELVKKIDISKEEIGDIIFEKVFFRYGSRVTVFNELNLKIKKNEFTAIVGESGCGKSTLISLLQNIYPIEKGNIYLGKYIIKNISNNSLRNLISVVPQKIDLFSGNLIDNIALGIFEPDLKKIHGILENLGMLDFVNNLPEGLYTYLGENGANLSGGQKQRIAIARALYKDPEILIFDEATSSLDSISEVSVQKTINLLKENGKTIILIAHRLSTVMRADNIIVMNKGKVIENGSHTTLMNRKESYFNLWRQQVPMIDDFLKQF